MGIYALRNTLGHKIKWVMGIVAVSVAIGAFFSFGFNSGSSGPKKQGGDQVIAKVNSVPITRSEFENTWSNVSQQYSQYGVQSYVQFADIRGMIFSQLLNSKRWLAAAQAQGVDISERTVNEEIDKQVTQFLKMDRQRVLGKVSKAQEAIDPREDKDYIAELAAATPPMSVRQREDFAKESISSDQIRSQIAQSALLNIARPSDDKVKASYNTYNLSIILLPVNAHSPKDQMQTKMNKILQEAKGGADFKALAKTYDDGPFKRAGSKFTVDFNNRSQMPVAFVDAIESMKPGDISQVIDLKSSLVLLKLDSITPKLPAKLDTKMLDDRRNQMMEQDKQIRSGDIMKKMTEVQKVVVFDPEMNAYWNLNDAMSQMTDMSKFVQMRKAAEDSLKTAFSKNKGNTFAASKLASLYMQDGNYKDSAAILSGLLSGTNRLENAELRKMLGDCLIKLGKQKDAVDNYRIAGGMSKNNPDMIKQLIEAYKAIKMPDMVKAEQASLADYETRKKLFDESQKRNASTPATTPAKAPAAPAKP